MIVSASRRTDIPAFFSSWLFNRIRQGFVYVRNPLNAHQVSKIDLSPRVVDCIVFWSKNPKRMIRRLRELDRYYYYFQYTINPYGQVLEPNVPAVEESMSTFRDLSQQIGPRRVVWRYDPIIVSEKFSVDYHIRSFQKMAERLSGKTGRCVVSFVDSYAKTRRNMRSIPYHEPTREQTVELAGRFATIGLRTGIEVASCAEKVELGALGIEHGKCIDEKLIEEIGGFELKVAKDESQRTECGCVASIDIGAYNSCPHACLYCYANYNHALVRDNYADHDPEGPLLFGNVSPQDRLTERKVVSCRIAQRELFSSKE